MTDQASTATAFQISPSWTLGGTATKMPFHMWTKIEGASSSGTAVGFAACGSDQGGFGDDLPRHGVQTRLNERLLHDDLERRHLRCFRAWSLILYCDR